MLTNEILEEIYQYRETYAESFNYDVAAMFADWRKRQAQSGRSSVTLHPLKRSNKQIPAPNQIKKKPGS
jgi:hypothetical protein